MVSRLESLQMIRKHKCLLLMLCLSLLLFKALSANRFIENGMKRAEIYADYPSFIKTQQQASNSNLVDVKNESTMIPSIHMLAIVLGFGLLLVLSEPKEILRPIIQVLIGREIKDQIFKPPKNTYIPA